MPLIELDNYLTVNKGKYEKNILNKYKDFNYDDDEEMELDLFFLLDIKNYSENNILKKDRDKDKQKIFSNKVNKKYKKCIISGDDSALEAAHIIELRNGGNYDIYNGILLRSDLHKLFDENIWCINPYTKQIEISGNASNMSKYIGKYIELDDITLNNMKERYKIFKKN
jgi:hypothetical protein